MKAIINCAIKLPEGSLKPGYAWRFWWRNEYLYYSSAREASNEVIRLYKGAYMPMVQKVAVLKGKDKEGTFFILVGNNAA